MAIFYPDMERETYLAAVGDRSLLQAQRALKAVVTQEIERGIDRRHILAVLDRLADEFGDQGETDHENAVLDVMDAMTGRVHPADVI